MWTRANLNSAISRLGKNSRKSGKCWIYTGAKSRDGYGKFTIGSTHIRAHRAAYIVHKGPIPKGKSILHSCDRPLCINPDHLEAGTAKKNTKDMWDRKRNKKSHLYTQKLKTTCVNGHRLVGDNVYHWRGHRSCKTCHRDRMREYARR